MIVKQTLNDVERSRREEAVLWSYRLIIGREPEDDQIVRSHAQALPSIQAIRNVFHRALRRSQFTTSDAACLDDFEVLSHFQSAAIKDGQPGFWYDFLGVKTRCEYLPPSYSMLSGAVEGLPGTEQAPLHEVAEWVGTLRSVLEAKERGKLVVIELGAGWAPWLVAAAKAGQQAGISDIKLVAVEGAKSHINFIYQHFEDNGLVPFDHVIIHGVAGSHDGFARFPKLQDPSAEWGGVASYSETTGLIEYEDVPCVSMDTLMRDFIVVDLIHCDVQGAELGVFLSAGPSINAKVRRVIVGTHSRRIEGELLNFFACEGWRLEEESACWLLQHAEAGPMNLTRDGYQVWRNPRIR